MSKIYNPYSDDWKDVKKSAKKQQDEWRSLEPVNKKFISDEIKKSEEKDNAEEQAEYKKIYQKIDDISTGGGADLSGYLKKTEAEETYAKKTDIPVQVDAYTKTESDEKYQTKGNYLTESDLTGYAKVEDIPAPVDAYTKAQSDEKYQIKGDYLTESDLTGYAKVEDIPDVSSFVTENDVEQKVSTAIAEVVADADEDFDTLKEIADYIASDKTKAAQIETAISNLQSDVEELDSTKAGKDDSYTKQESDAKYLTSHQDISALATKDELAAVEASIPSVEGLVTEEELTATTQNFATISQVAAVEAQIPSVEGLVTEEELTAATQNFATISQVAEIEAQIPSVEGLVSQEELTAATQNFATISQVAAVDQKVDSIDLTQYAKVEDIPTVPTKVSELENDANYLTQHQDISNLATKTELEAVEASIPSVEGLVTEEELTAATQNFATISQVAAVDQKVDNIDLTPYAKTEDIPTKVSELENDANYLTEHQDISALATKTELNEFKNKLWKGDVLYTKYEKDGKTALIFNENDGGGIIYEDKPNNIKSFVGVNDGGAGANAVNVQIYSKDVSTNTGARLNVNKNGIYYAVGSSAVIAPELELAVKGDIPAPVDLTDYAKTADVNDALAQKANIDDVSTSLEEKANTDDVNTALEGKVSATEYNALKARFDYLERYVNDYLALTLEQLEEKNDEIINTLSPEKKTVDILTPMESVVIPEANNNAYTVNVPLEEGSTVELTSNKYAYLNNTSDDPVSVSMGREIPQEESESASNPTLYITGQYENITVENLSISQKDTDVNAVKNVTITENTTKPVSLTLSLQDGATITNDSSVAVTVNNKAVVPEDGEPTNVTVVAPNSTVTVSGGKYSTFESTVGDDTLYINKAAHINKLVVKKGNVIVNDWNVEDHIDEIENGTEYTVSPKVIEVTTKSDWTKASSTPAIYEVQNNIETNSRIAPGIFGSSAKIKMNGYTVNCSDANGAFVLRGDSHYIIENGTIDSSAYGIWLSGPGTVELKDMTISAHNHALYIEKPNGNIYTTGNCRFSVKDEDTRYVANYFDSTYTGGWTTGFHFGAGTEFVDFDPMNSMGEPNGPVNLLDEGYHTESYQEDGHTIYKVVKDSE